ncbi:hypothetical protein [Thalassoroseus pseudoceratinae]|uniref:hypothetical protein n=1 Tax=Thalassoroseus pseudoceratinae TaxID=2713176 RepID=UPI00141F32E6|nr:hypothetical protein [Thalassoroseus pseudoceratinae]
MKTVVFPIAIYGLLVFSVCGCGSDPHAGESSSHAEEEHLEHHVPEHKPPNFSAAVDSIQDRIQELETSSSSASDEHELSELKDIVNWLPEIAADSDMRRRHWEEVDAVASELSRQLEQYTTESADSQDELTTKLATTAETLTPLKGTEKGETE